MALKLSKTKHGIVGEYWQIYQLAYQKDTGKTLARMRCYANQAARDVGLSNYINDPIFKKTNEFAGVCSMEDAYKKWKTSKIATASDIFMDGDAENTSEENLTFIKNAAGETAKVGDELNEWNIADDV